MYFKYAPFFCHVHASAFKHNLFSYNYIQLYKGAQNLTFEQTQNKQDFSEFNFSSQDRDGDGELNIDADSISDLRSDGSNGSIYATRTTTIKVNGKDYPVVIEESPATMAKHILHHNGLHGYTLVTMIGKSGTGKSTITRTLTHYLHTKGQSLYGRTYVPMWFKQKDIESLDDIIASLEVGVNRILNFEDVSFTFNDAESGQLEEVMRRLTYIRHTLKANVIIQMQIHYSKALDKFLRDGDVKIITSSSDEEKENLKRLFGRDGNRAIKNFAGKYHSMEAYGYWTRQVTVTKLFRYKVQEPFRLALVSDFGKLHNMVYHDISCDYCKPKFESVGGSGERKYDNYQAAEFLKEVAETYSQSRLRSVLRHFLYYKEGVNTLEPKSKHVVSKLLDYFQNNPDQYQNFIGEVKQSRTLDQVLRKLGILEGPLKHEEKRKKRNLGMKEQALRRKLERQRQDSSTTPIEVTAEQLEIAGVPSMDPGVMSDEDIASQGDNEV